jgi:hypothetical protein
MKKLLILIAFFLTASALAQEALTEWPFYVEVSPSAQGLCDLTVSPEVFDRAREDLADLRLYDSRGREVPYALRVRRDVNQQEMIGASEFNRARSGERASELSLDLGQDARSHNEVEISTEGVNFRRRVDIEGSDDGKQWRVIVSGAIIFSFESLSSRAESSRISYPASRHRFLRVRVFADEQIDRESPNIAGVEVLMSAREQEEILYWGESFPYHQSVRSEGEPASAWTVEMEGRVPVDRLAVDVNAESFSRPYVLETADDPQNPRLVASGVLARRAGEERKKIIIKFDEVFAKKLRLIVTDYRNPALPISSIQAAAPARQVIFDTKNFAPPLKMYFGNHRASEPHYDFGNDLPARLISAPARCEAGNRMNNTDFTPEPEPLTERAPWLVYVALAASSAALGSILWSLARDSMRAGDQKPAESEEA